MATIRASANAPGSDTALRKQMGELQAKGAKAKRKFDMDTLARVEAELYVVVLGGNQYIFNWFYEVNLPLDRVFVCCVVISTSFYQLCLYQDSRNSRTEVPKYRPSNPPVSLLLFPPSFPCFLSSSLLVTPLHFSPSLPPSLSLSSPRLFPPSRPLSFSLFSSRLHH